MTTIKTHDIIGGGYLDETPGGPFGCRNPRDRRYWTAWAQTGRLTRADCHPGVMDDFGSLVPVPDLEPQH